MYRSPSLGILLCLLVWVAPGLDGLAHAQDVTYEQVLEAVMTARHERCAVSSQYLDASRALVAALAKNPPGPGWADLDGDDGLYVDDIRELWICLTFARDLDLYGRRDKATRRIFACLAERCHRVAMRYAQGSVDAPLYAARLAHMPEYARYAELRSRPYPAYVRAWSLAAAYFRQQAAGDGPKGNAGKRPCGKAPPAMRRLKTNLDALKDQADAMARDHGARITQNWPRTLAWTQEIYQILADLWDMAQVADVSERTSTEGLKWITDLCRYENDKLDLFTSGRLEREGGYPPLSPPERRFAKKLLRVMKAYDRSVDFDKRLAVGNKAGAIYYLTR